MSGLAACQARAFHFRNIAEEMEWAPRTQGSYWGAILTLMQLGGMAWGPEDRALGRQLEVMVQTAPSWDLLDSAEFLTPLMVEQLTKAAAEHLYGQPQSPPAIVPAMVAMMLGQRLGDVLKLLTINIRCWYLEIPCLHQRIHLVLVRLSVKEATREIPL
jgi:hypothetical protein